MDQLAAMRAFARIVELRSFTRAAQVLQMPKPSVTKLIQGLEAHLSTRLLSRTTRRLAVTPEGAAYYERVVRLLADIEEMDSSMVTSRARPRGTLRIDVSSSLAQRVLIPALPGFFALYPDIQIDLGVSDGLTDLAGENVDCVLRAGPLADSDLIARRVADLDFASYAAPSYLDRHGIPAHPEELGDAARGHRAVSFFKASSGRHYPFLFTRGAERIEVTPPRLLAVNEGASFVAAGCAGLGIIQAPVFSLRRELAAGELAAVLPEWASHRLPLHVVYAPNRHLSHRLRVFVDWVAAMLAGQALGR